MDSEVELVLNGGKEGLGVFCLGAVIQGRGVDVGDLLVELALAGANFPYQRLTTRCSMASLSMTCRLMGMRVVLNSLK